MEKVTLWWRGRSPRDRRAMLVLGVVMPMLLFWYLITVPLQDRLKMAQRVLETRRSEATDVQRLLQEYSMRKSQLAGFEFKADASVVPELEQVFRELTASDTRPVLNRANIVIFGKSQPAAHILVNEAHPQSFWKAFELLASSGVYIAELEITATAKTNVLSAACKAWLSVKNLPQ